MWTRDLGYRPWQGKTVPAGFRWSVVALTGIRLAWRSRWVRRVLLLAWAPALYCGVGIFFFENAVKQGTLQPVTFFLRPYAEVVPELERISIALSQHDHALARHRFWAWVLWLFFRHPQGFMLIILVGVIAPDLIARDLRSRAYLIYFSRPLTAWEYLCGKSAVLWFYLSLITFAPAVTLYLIGVFLSPDLSVVKHTWDLPFRIAVASVVLILPTSCLALCFSSLTTESRYAAFAWYAVCFGGWIAYVALSAADVASGPFVAAPLASRWAFVSLYHSLGQVQNGIFGLQDYSDALPAYSLGLATLTLVSLAIVHRRVLAPLRV
ncbi:MAG: hypothetical protein KatS3mg110_4250 [Pirellulaceae bacterium]|nr:MAG: hypothetical protein KatS3mg110_4250 [Pirellulaceae bacterium]